MANQPSIADLRYLYYGGASNAEYTFLQGASAAGVTALDTLEQAEYAQAMRAMAPTNAIAETVSRAHAAIGNASVLTSGTIHMGAIALTRGQVCTTATFSAGATAAGTPTNQWFVLADSVGEVIRFTNNDTTTAWNALTTKTLTFTTPYTVPTTGVYYLGLMVAATTVPSLNSITYGTAPVGIAPRPCFTGQAGQTTVPGLPFTLTMTSVITKPWGWIS